MIDFKVGNEFMIKLAMLKNDRKINFKGR